MCVLVSGFSYRTFPYAKNRLAESGKKLFLGNVLVTLYYFCSKSHKREENRFIPLESGSNISYAGFGKKQTFSALLASILLACQVGNMVVRLVICQSSRLIAAIWPSLGPIKNKKFYDKLPNTDRYSGGVT